MLPSKYTCQYYLTQVVPTCSISRTSGVSGCASRASIYASRAALALARIAARISLNFFCLPVCILFFTVCTLRDWYSLSASRSRTSSLCSRRVSSSISSDESSSDIDESVPAPGLVTEGRAGFLKGLVHPILLARFPVCAFACTAGPVCASSAGPVCASSSCKMCI